MTDSPPDPAPSDLETFATGLAAAVGATRWTAEHRTVHIYVERSNWVAALTTARDEAGLDFFSWLSAVDWARDVQVGEPAADVENLEERYEVLCRVSSIADGSGAIFVTVLDKADAWVDSLVPVYVGAEWHEREAAEMFGINFRGHPNLVKLYLPDGFEGHPLRKSFALAGREVKPWPGIVDVEGLPATENPETGEAS